MRYYIFLGFKLKIYSWVIIFLTISVVSLFAPPGDSVSSFSQNEYIFELNHFKIVDKLIFDFIINELKDNYKKVEFHDENIGSYRKKVFKKYHIEQELFILIAILNYTSTKVIIKLIILYLTLKLLLQ